MITQYYLKVNGIEEAFPLYCPIGHMSWHFNYQMI